MSMVFITACVDGVYDYELRITMGIFEELIA